MIYEKNLPVGTPNPSYKIRAISDTGASENVAYDELLGVMVAEYLTYADLPNPGNVNNHYKVTQDPTAAKNGIYHWDGTDYVLDTHISNVFTEDIGTTVYNTDVYNVVLRASVAIAEVGYVYKIGNIYRNNATQFNRIDIFKEKIADGTETNITPALKDTGNRSGIMDVTVKGTDGVEIVLTINYDAISDGGAVGFSTTRMIIDPQNYIGGTVLATINDIGQNSFQRFFKVYNKSVDIMEVVQGVNTNFDAHNVIQEIRLFEGWDSTKIHKLGFIRRNNSSDWAIIINEWNGSTWDRVYYGHMTSESSEWDVTDSGRRVIATLDWTKIADGFSSSLWGNDETTGEPAIVFNKSVYSGVKKAGLPEQQEDYFSARSGYELFPCFYRVGEGSIDTVFVGSARRYQALSSFKSLKILNADPTKPVKLSLYRRNELGNGSYQLIFNQLIDGVWSRIFYSGDVSGNYVVNPNGATHFDYTDSSTGVRVVAEIDWNYVEDGTSGGVEPETGDAIFAVKPEMVFAHDILAEQSANRTVAYDGFHNESPHIMAALTGIRNKLLERADDIEILLIGDSLTAFYNKTPISNPEHSPCQMICLNYPYHIWNYLNDVEIDADRFDSTKNPFSETGTWVDGYEFFESGVIPYWTADTMGNGEITRYTNDANASVSFSWDLDSYEKMHFIHRLDYRGTNSVTVAIAEGDGKAEVWNGTAWVEVNGYNFSQQLTENVEGSGYSNTLSNWRLKMRKASGATGTINLTFSKGADSDYMFYWGTEKWNGNRIIISNSSRGGREVHYFGDVVLNDIVGRKPDMVLMQLMLINDYDNELTSTHLTQTIIDFYQDFIFGDRVGYENTNSLKNLSNDWADFELLTVVPHYRYEYFTHDNVFKKTDIFNTGDYMDETALIVWNKVKKMIADKGVQFVDMGSAIKREAFARGWVLKETFNSSGLISDNGFTIDTVHPNDLGSLIWAKYLATIFDVTK